MPLSPLRKRAISLLSLGMSTSDVAQQLKVSRMTLCRWKREKEFQRALDRSTGELMDGVLTQVQTTARVMVEAGLEATHELRHIVLNPRAKDHDRRLAACGILRYAQRFYDMLGFNAKFSNRRKLHNEELDDLDDAEGIEREPHESECEPGDRHLRPEAEIDPPAAGHGPGARPDEFYDWGNNPINEDGTPIHPPEPEPEPETEPATNAEAANEAESGPIAESEREAEEIAVDKKAIAAQYARRAACKRPSRAKGKVRRAKPHSCSPGVSPGQRRTNSKSPKNHPACEASRTASRPTAGILPASP